MSQFLEQTVSSNIAVTENCAISNFTTGSIIVDQFGRAGTFRDRTYDQVAADCAKAWGENPLAALRLMFYLRLITRKIVGEISTDSIQKGQGQRDEFFKRMAWLAKNHFSTFEKVLMYVPLFGTYKDYFDMLRSNLFTQRSVDKIYECVVAGLASEQTSNLVKKYLPAECGKVALREKYSRKEQNTQIARALRSKLGLSSSAYRKMKASGTAHQWQQAISNKSFGNINFKTVASRALAKMVDSKFLGNHNLEYSYMKWLESQGSLNFNGYPYELYKMATKKNVTNIKEFTLNKMFDGLLAKSEPLSGNVWCALDTSGSMVCEVAKGTQAVQVCVGLGLYFSALNTGKFKDFVVMFDDESRGLKLSGSFVDKVRQIKAQATAWGSTNFQSIIDLMISIREKSPSIPIEDYPEIILVISDMQFNPSGYNMRTNYQDAKVKLASVFPKEYVDKIKFVWWQVNGEYGNDHPSTMGNGGTYVFSGFDGGIIDLLLGKSVAEKHKVTMEEMVKISLNQEILLNLTL